MTVTTDNGLEYETWPTSPFFYESPVRLGKATTQGGVRIGRHTYINSGRICSETYIGRYCSIGNNVTIGTGHHDLSLMSTSPHFTSEVKPSYKYVDGNPQVKVKIGNDVWIGNNVTILTGVKIGDGAVIGAGAVVTKEVEAYSIVAGVPATHLRYRFKSLWIRRGLSAIKWWEIDPEILKTHKLNYDVQADLDWLNSLPDSARISDNYLKI